MSSEWLMLLTQLAVLATPLLILGNTFISLYSNRKLASKADVAQVHELVNGKTERLERMLIAKGRRKGVAEERAKTQKPGGADG